MARDHPVSQDQDLHDDWLRQFEDYRVDIVALSLHGDRGLVKLLRSDGRWEAECEDGERVLFLCSDADRTRPARIRHLPATWRSLWRALVAFAHQSRP